MPHCISVLRTTALLTAGILLTLASSSLSAAAQDTVQIEMVNNSYEPSTLTVPVGTRVRFVNHDSEIHTVSQRGGGFESGLLFQGDSWTYVFNTPGTYEYFCLPHPFMVGTIIVE